ELSYFEVFVVLMDIRIRMMHNIVCDLPDVSVCAEQIEGESKRGIDFVTLGVGSMESIVRNGETDSSHADTHHHTHQPHGPQGESAGHEQGISAKIDR